METLTLGRYHAHGNDFVVTLLSEQELVALEAELSNAGVGRDDLARAVCDRQRGVGHTTAYDHERGGDGFIIGVDRSPHDCVRMHLLNSDGSFAQTSGNGLACLALALVDAGVASAGKVDIETDAGRQWCDLGFRPPTRSGDPDELGDGAARGVGVAMNAVTDGPVIGSELASQIEADLGGSLLHYATGDVGNPHLVVALDGPINAARTAELGAAYETHFDEGINVEFVWNGDPAERPSAAPRIVMSVWERGAGLTRACGTGSVVAATRARDWSMTDDGESVLMATSEFSYSVDLGSEPVLWVTAECVERGLPLALRDVAGPRL